MQQNLKHFQVANGQRQSWCMHIVEAVTATVGNMNNFLWVWLAHIPGLIVIVLSTPADAGGLMLAASQHDGPIIFLEHKLLSKTWLEWWLVESDCSFP